MTSRRPSFRPSPETLELRDLPSTLQTAMPPITEEIAARLEQSIVAHWAADDSAMDAKANANGTLQGGLGFAPGKIGDAFAIDRPDVFAVMPSTEALNFGTTDAFSIGAWAQVTDTQGIAFDSALSLVRKGSLSGGGASYGMVLRPGWETPVIDVWLQGTGTGRIYWRGTVNVDVTGWHHYAMSYDGSSNIQGLHVYVDGKEIQPTYSENALSSSIKNDGPLAIAQGFARNPVEQFAPGRIDDITVRIGALTPELVAAVFAMDDYRSQPPAPTPSLVDDVPPALSAAAPTIIAESPVASVAPTPEVSAGPLYFRASVASSQKTDAGWTLTVDIASPGNNTRVVTEAGKTIATASHPGGTRKTTVTFTYPEDGQNLLRLVDGDTGAVVQNLENRREDGTFGLRPGIDAFVPCGMEPADGARNPELTIPNQITVDPQLRDGKALVRFSMAGASAGINVYDDNGAFLFQRLISSPGGIANGEILMELPDATCKLLFIDRMRGVQMSDVMVKKSCEQVQIVSGGQWTGIGGACAAQATPQYHLPAIDAPSLQGIAKYNIMVIARLQVTQTAEEISRRIAPSFFTDDASPSARSEQIWSVQKELGYVDEVIAGGAAAAFSELLYTRMGKQDPNPGSVEGALRSHPRIGVIGSFGVIPDATTVRSAVAATFDVIYAKLCGIEGDQQALYRVQNALVIPAPATISPEIHQRIMETILESVDGIGTPTERVANYVEANRDAMDYIPASVRSDVIALLQQRNVIADEPAAPAGNVANTYEVASAGVSTGWEWTGTQTPTAPILSPAQMNEFIGTVGVIRSAMQNGAFDLQTITKFAKFMGNMAIRKTVPVYQSIDARSDIEAFEILKQNGLLDYHAGLAANNGKLIVIVDGHSQELTENGQYVGMNNLADKFKDYEVLHFKVGSALNPITLNPDAVYQATSRILNSRIHKTGQFAEAPSITHLGGSGYSWGAGTLVKLVNAIRPTTNTSSAPFTIDVALIDAVELGYTGMAMPVLNRPNADHVFNRYEESGNTTLSMVLDNAMNAVKSADWSLVPSYIDGPVELSLLLAHLKQAIIDRGQPAHGAGLVGMTSMDDERIVKWVNPSATHLELADHTNIDNQETIDPSNVNKTIIDAAYEFLFKKVQ